MSRVIALVDCDSFFVSCEQKDNPSIKNKPVCVLTSVDTRGVVVSRSKQAKSLGIKMGAPYFQLKGEYEGVTYLPVRHERYDEISKEVMRVVKGFSPDVEVVSVDEAFVDLTSLNKFYNKSYTDIIKDMRTEVLKQVDIPVSIGLSTSKTLAKLASDKAKTMGGIFVIRPERILDIVKDIEMIDVSGVGKSTADNLFFHEIRTIGDFLKKDPLWIRKEISYSAEKLYYELLGQAINLVNNKEMPPQSIQDTKSFESFSNDKEFLKRQLHKHIHHSSQKLRFWNGFCSSLAVTLRTKEFQVFETEIKLDTATNSERTLLKLAYHLVDKLYRYGVMYRSVGVTLKNLSFGEEKQLTLFDTKKVEDDKISHIIDDMENKFGKHILKLGL